MAMFGEMNERLGAFGVIPVVVLNDAEEAEPLAEALIRGGLGCAEVTFRTACAQEAIRRISARFPEMLVGAGTVLSVEQVKRARAAGAKFIVSPGFDAEVVDYCIGENIPVYPGVMTPSEVMQGVKRGLEVLKFFPASQAGGTAMIKALCGPFPGIRFIPTGGVSEKNMQEYLELPAVAAIGGSWMVKKDLIIAGEFDKISAMTGDAVKTVRTLRG
ncbi:MAG: bifunctional 4-hydroxy-2-oxoglutarate aldolase/2-dehydro-3-deoxy-phosphogluconate aldolase [Eubacteriales bacterium]|nr:bifunctional 4-hydroxy-2-oxoglutarate aldolase/2-dehydro-3-deoxy-phosphogluconate aldolase [Eubacteriales bacterium]